LARRFEQQLQTFFYRADEDAGALLAASEGLPEPYGPVFQEMVAEYLAFSLENELYAVPIERVREIVKVPLLTEVPRAKSEVLGVMNLRGEVIPVYDVKPRLHLSQQPSLVRGPGDVPRASRVVLLRDDLGDAGILVDSVSQVVKLPAAGLEQAPAAAESSAAVAGIGRKNDQLYIVLDVTEVLR
jgi:purine-binding chemotaxis protein CheW